MRPITLTTDFGSQDWFVGTMKGVILSISPMIPIVDITHEMPPGNICAGAFALMASYRFFPKDTVHVAVVDPGVGSERKAIAVQTANYFFVGPDNGILSFALANEKIRNIHRLENTRYFLKSLSHTFHGRDVFAPVAAHLSRGVAIDKLGPKEQDIVRLPWPKPEISQNLIISAMLSPTSKMPALPPASRFTSSSMAKELAPSRHFTNPFRAGKRSQYAARAASWKSPSTEVPQLNHSGSKSAIA